MSPFFLVLIYHFMASCVENDFKKKGNNQIRTFLNVITINKEFSSIKNNDVNNRCLGK